MAFHLSRRSSATPEKKTEQAKSDSRLFHTNNQVCIRLDKRARELAGLETVELRESPVPAEAKAYGRVLDPVPLTALAAEIASDRATLDASQKEYSRLN